MTSINNSPTLRVITHKPTGDRYVVLRLDFQDERAYVCRVMSYQGDAVRRVSKGIDLPLSECTRPETVRCTALVLADLWRNGVKADARDSGHDLVIEQKRSGGYRARKLPTVAEAEADRALVEAVAPAAEHVIATTTSADTMHKVQRTLDSCRAHARYAVEDAKHRECLATIKRAAAKGEDALLALAVEYEAAGLPHYARLALDAQPG